VERALQSQVERAVAAQSSLAAVRREAAVLERMPRTLVFLPEDPPG